MLTPDQVNALLDRTLDLGFLVRTPDIDVRVLRREPLVAVFLRSMRLPGTPPYRSLTSGRTVQLTMVGRRGSARRWVARGRVTRLGVP